MSVRGEYSQAEGLLTRAHDASPSHVGTLIWLVMLHLDVIGDAEAAERYAAIALGASPTDPRAISAHAVCLERRGDAVGAEEAHRDAVKRPQAPSAAFRR